MGLSAKTSENEDIDDDDAYVRESIRQGIDDILNGDVLTEEEFWKAVAEIRDL